MKICMVLEDETIRPLGEGLITDAAAREEFGKLLNRAFFIERDFVETRSRFKQIIPYCVATWYDSRLVTDTAQETYVLTYKRKSKHTEQRLAQKWSIGFGGHIEPKDAEGTARFGKQHGIMAVMQAAQREFGEETGLKLDKSRFVGLLNLDEPGPVERVHLGAILNIDLTEFHRDLPEIKPKDDEADRFKWVKFSIFSAPGMIDNNWEAWSKIVLENRKELFQLRTDG